MPFNIQLTKEKIRTNKEYLIVQKIDYCSDWQKSTQVVNNLCK